MTAWSPTEKYKHTTDDKTRERKQGPTHNATFLLVSTLSGFTRRVSTRELGKTEASQSKATQTLKSKKTFRAREDGLPTRAISIRRCRKMLLPRWEGQA